MNLFIVIALIAAGSSLLASIVALVVPRSLQIEEHHAPTDRRSRKSEFKAVTKALRLSTEKLSSSGMLMFRGLLLATFVYFAGGVGLIALAPKDGTQAALNIALIVIAAMLIIGTLAAAFMAYVSTRKQMRKIQEEIRHIGKLRA